MAVLNAPIAIDRGRGGSGPSHSVSPDYRGRLRRARLGLAVALTPILMLFVSFTSAYIMRQGLPMLDDASGRNVSDWVSVNLPVALLLVNTGLLVLSSITMELARRQMGWRVALSAIGRIPGVKVGEEREVPWLGVTVVLGLGFLVGQCFAWRELARRGLYLATSPSSSFVYLLTAAHAVHLAGGVVALLYAVAMSRAHKSVESRCIVVDTTAWYWHFMALLWIYIFVLLQFAR